jgi:hypothetical protein
MGKNLENKGDIERYEIRNRRTSECWKEYTL